MEFPEPPLDQRGLVRQAISEQSQLNLPYLVMNMLAAALAVFGLYANSPAVVIGAMIVALLLGPIIGLSLGVVDSNPHLFRQAAGSLLVGAAAVYAVALIMGLVLRRLPMTGEILSRTHPTILDLLIALAAGAAGAIATVSPRLSAAVVGIAIATALVPPLAASALLMARNEYHLGWQALLLAFTNVVAIQFGSSIVLLISGYGKRGKVSHQFRTWLTRNVGALAVLLLLTAVLTVNLRDVLAAERFETSVKRIVRDEIGQHHPLAYLDEVRFDVDKESGHLVVRAVVRTIDPIGSSEVAAIEDQLPSPASGRKVELRVSQIRIDIVTRTGPMAEKPTANGG